jgi:hypothetical protein
VRSVRSVLSVGSIGSRGGNGELSDRRRAAVLAVGALAAGGVAVLWAHHAVDSR